MSWRKPLLAFSTNTVSKNLMLTEIYWTNECIYPHLWQNIIAPIAALPALMQKTFSRKWCRMSELKSNINNTIFLMLRMTSFLDLAHYLAFSEHNILQTESVFIFMCKCREVSAQQGLTEKVIFNHWINYFYNCYISLILTFVNCSAQYEITRTLKQKQSKQFLQNMSYITVST